MTKQPITQTARRLISCRTVVLTLLMMVGFANANAQARRPIDSQHPLWLVHVDVWNQADPQKIIDLIPDDIKPYVCMNLSLSCGYDPERDVHKMPQNAVKTYKSWATVCQHNGMWFTCQPASGGKTHILDDDLETFEYFFKHYPNFLGWNYAEQFWGFDEGNKYSSSQPSRIALFAKLVEMSHRYGGFLTVSFCGNIWSHPLNPVGMLKRNANLLEACKKYPEAMLWLYKYTTSSCFYNNESVTYSPFISGLTANYGVRYDNCGWNGALDGILGENHGKKYPTAAGIGTVMEQTCINGGAVWDGPELIWTEDFQNLSNSTVNGYTRRNWGVFPGFRNIWLDMFRKIINGEMYIPSRAEAVEKTKIIVVNDISSGNDEQKYAAWGDLYNGLYKQDDPFNRGNGQWMDNFCYFKKTGRYATIPVAIGLYDSLARAIPVQVKKSTYTSRWSTQTKKVNEFNKYYPEVSSGDLFVARHKNQLVTYTPYTYLNSKKTASAKIPLLYNTCESLSLNYGKLSSGCIREYADHIDLYLNNFRTDTTTIVLDEITISGATTEPTYKVTKRVTATTTTPTKTWDAESGTFTLSIKHNGPVDVTINCSGDQTERSNDTLPSTPLSLPKQPETYYGEVTIEAEDMDFKSIKSCVTNPYDWYPSVRGHAGNGFADMGTNTTGALTHKFKAKTAGTYTIAIRYMSTTKSSTVITSVNKVRKALRLEQTAFNEWKRATFEATMKQGDNELVITNTGGASMYIDNVTYYPEGIPFEKFAINIRQAEHGTVIASADSAAEGEHIVLTVEPDEGYRLSGWTSIHGDAIIASDNSFTMPDDNVTLSPVFSDVTSVYQLDYTGVVSGAMPQGWQAIQEDNTLHNYPNTYSSGARTFVGLTGYQGSALYWRNDCAEFGRQADFPLNLEAGKHKVTFANAAWKGTPRYKVQITTASGTVIAESSSYLASPNINGNFSGNITNAHEYELEFTVTTPGKYIIRFVNASGTAGGFTEFLIASCRVNTIPETDAIELIESDRQSAQPETYYDINGVQLNSPRRGLNIVRTADGRSRKVLFR